jgi:hypothetical protein
MDGKGRVGSQAVPCDNAHSEVESVGFSWQIFVVRLCPKACAPEFKRNKVFLETLRQIGSSPRNVALIQTFLRRQHSILTNKSKT